MKLRHLATVVFLALTTIAAHAQTEQGNVGLYFNPIAIRASNSIAESGPYAFLGQNSTSQVFFGYDLGGYYDFFHSGKLATGFDMRYSDLHANNALLRDFLVGIRVSATPLTAPSSRISRHRSVPAPPRLPPAPFTLPSWTTPSSAESTTPWPTTWTSASSKLATVR